MRRPLSVLLAALTLAAPALADTITRTDGRVIEDVDVLEAGLVETTYKRGATKQTIASEDILSIEYRRKPRVVDEADQALVEGDPYAALYDFDQWADGQIERPDRRYKWSGAYAAWRSIEVCQLLDDVRGVIERCDRLIEGYPDSRHVPAAYLARAAAQSRTGDLEAARESLQGLIALVESKGLSRRWKLDAELGLILTDANLQGSDQRARLEEIASQAGREFPTVANRARVGIGETYLNEIEAASPERKRELAEQAREVFDGIVEDHKAEAETMAAAYTGLGTAQFHAGALADEKELTREAFLNFMRVIVLYEQQSRYVAKSMFYAMLCLQSFEDEESLRRSREMRFELMSRYPDSSWAKQAENR